MGRINKAIFNELDGGDEVKDVLVDVFHFKRGKRLVINGQAKKAEQIYKFQKVLLDKKNISNVKIQNMAEDKKSKKIKFTMTFHYKSFTKRVSKKTK